MRSTLARRMLMAEVSEGLVRGRPRLGWMNGVKVVFVSRGMMWRLRNIARKISKSGDPWRIYVDH